MKTCNLCQGEKFILWCKKDGFDILQCCVCGLIFADLGNDCEHNSEKTSGVPYDKSYFDGSREIDFEKEAPFFRTRFNDRLKRLEKYKQRNIGRLLDIGCATGLFLAAAKAQGWEADGIEISDYAASISSNKGFNVYTSLDDCKLQQPVYDAIAMWHVLEHIENPRSILAKVRSLLKPGGVIAIEVPDIESKPAMCQKENWHFVKPPEHIHYFSEDTLRKLLKSVYFVPIESVKLSWGTGMAEKAQNIGFGIGANIKASLRVVPGMSKLRDWIIRHLAEPEVLLIIASKSR